MAHKLTIEQKWERKARRRVMNDPTLRGYRDAIFSDKWEGADRDGIMGQVCTLPIKEAREFAISLWGTLRRAGAK
jgi:hypothetical protein